jgi:hypothetical protein
MGMQRQKSGVVLIATGVMLAGSLLLSPLAEPLANSSVNRNKPKTNSEFVLSVAQSDQKLAPLMLNKAKLASFISNELKKVEHVTPTDKDLLKELVFMNSPKASELEQFDQCFLVKVSYLLKALSDKSFVKQIGGELMLDVADGSCEHGGTMFLKRNGKVGLKMIPNDPTAGYEILPSQSWANNYYFPTSSQYRIDMVFPFHFHVQNVPNNRTASLMPGEFSAPEAVFSTVGKNKFNVDVGVVLNNQQVNIDLGVYTY